jgi:sensor histidine kinase YesM
MQFERLRKAEISQAAELAARSFLDYAYFSIFVPNEKRRFRFLNTMLSVEFSVNDDRAELWAAKEDEKIVTVAMLCSPAYHKPTDSQYMKAGFWKVFLAGGIKAVSDWNAMDAGVRLENFYAYAIEPKGTMGFMDGQGKRIAAFRNGAWDLSPETEQINKSGLFISQPLEFGHYSFFEYLETQQEYSFAGHLPLLFWALVILTLLGFAALPLIFKMSDKLLISPVSRLLEAMDQLGQGNMKIRLPEKANTADVEFMNRGFNRMAEEIHSLRIKTYEQEIEKLKTEAINLKLQVNPHMYLNALNTIYSLGRVGKTKEICDFTVLLMQYFRYSFRSDAEFSTVKDEIAFVTSYMKIQGMRFPGSFSFAFGLDPSVENTMIPRFIIENFAENTVKYALQSEKETEIIIQVRAQDNRLFISIVDDGCGMDEATLKTIQSGEVLEDNSGRHTGIWNSRRRLDFYYGKDYELSITSSLGKGTQVYLSLPMKMPNKADEPLRY